MAVYNMSAKLDALRQLLKEIGALFPDLQVDTHIYLTPKIMAVAGMSPMEIQVCEGACVYEEIGDGCRSENFMVQVGVFRIYRLDPGGKHAKALSNLTYSIYQDTEKLIDVLDGSFLLAPPDERLTRPLIIKGESEVLDAGEGQLLKTLSFVAGLNYIMATVPTVGED